MSASVPSHRLLRSSEGPKRRGVRELRRRRPPGCRRRSCLRRGREGLQSLDPGVELSLSLCRSRLSGVHGTEGVHFYTRGKAVTSRWLDPSPGGVNLGFPVNQ
jgi:hypothetical protein